jgi:chemotaxis methyl-accepting protein methylase
MNDEQFRLLLDRFRFSWKGYRKVRQGVKKRIRRHMSELGCTNLEAYLQALQDSDALFHECERLMTVSISRFFRDQRLWDALRDNLLPGFTEGRKDRVRVWSAGCASGEEIYSFKIIWEGMRDSCLHLPELGLLGTDMNPDYLERARSGVYSPGSLREVPAGVKRRFFEKQAGKDLYAVIPPVREGIEWREHRLSGDPPGSAFEIIFLRNNLLTYYGAEIQEAAFRKVAGSLAPSGYLIIGTHERLPVDDGDLESSSSHPCVFRKRV